MHEGKRDVSLRERVLLHCIKGRAFVFSRARIVDVSSPNQEQP